MRLGNAEHENLKGEGEKSHLLRVPGQGVWACYTGTYRHRPAIIGDPRHVGLNIFWNLPVPRQGPAWWGNLENPPWTEGASTPALHVPCRTGAELPELQVFFQEKQEINFFECELFSFKNVGN